MNLTVGYIPYLNMLPFHQGFGPDTQQAGDVTIQFKRLSPRALGLAAEGNQVDAGAMSLVDTFRLAGEFEPLGDFGIGVKHAAGSVLLFSRRPIGETRGICSVTDETSTSFRLLQVLLNKKYGCQSVSYGRVASSLLFDGATDALLLIGDEALRARREGIKGLPVVTDLATEWYAWQETPFVFARWMVRKSWPEAVKCLLHKYLNNSLKTSILARSEMAYTYAQEAGLTPAELFAYWDGFLYKLTPDHQHAIEKFKELADSVCLTV